MPPRAAGTVLVVPCFNEVERLRPADIGALAAHPGVHVLLVNDGSTDATLALLRSLEQRHATVDVVDLPTNRGKAEAVRVGMQRAAAGDAVIVGFCDADMATPVDELLRLNDLAAADPHLDALLASRVALLGHRVDRSITRHYFGRLFATASSIVLRTRVYDTQCGAKYFRNTAMLRSALTEPFHSRWSFDVELLGRLLGGGHGQPAVSADAILEVPLKVWSDVGGSKLTTLGSIRAGTELLVIARALRTWRRAG
ncbi:MAG: glycosyltransferase [Ilumatobacteraceae bacterium]